MGNKVYNEKNPWKYNEFINEEAKEGETKILRRPDLINKELPKTTELGISTIIDAFKNNLKKFPEKRFLGTREHIEGEKFGDHYNWKNYKEINEIITQFIYGIETLNLCPEIIYKDEKFKFLGIYSKNREEWITSYLGCQLNSIIVVTLYDTLGLNAIEFILNQTELISIVIESSVLIKIIKLKEENKVGKLKNLIVAICPEEDINIIDSNIEKLKNLGFNVYKYEELLNIGKNNLDKKYTLIQSTPDTYTTFCYTSGTTGNPKGAMIKNKNLMGGIHAMDTIGRRLKESDIYLSFLPLAHIMEQLIVCVNIYYATSYAFYSGSPKRINEDCQILKPTYLCSVPRILEKIYDEINNKINKMSYIETNIAKKAIKTKIKNYKEYGILTHALYDKIVFSKIQKILGGKLEWILVGSAPISSEIITFLRICFSIPITEGYGQTEDCAGVLLANINDITSGHLGGVDAPIELKLIDVPELDYSSKDINKDTNLIEPRGEICIRGVLVFNGYYKDEEITKECLDENGWLHSGDIGVILTGLGNAVKIIDRRKNIFKLSQGEYIAPEKIHSILSKSKFVNQIYIHGESLYYFLVGIIYPEKSECVKFLCDKGFNVNEENVEDYYKEKILIDAILKDLEIIGKKGDLKGFELVKKIFLCKEGFTIENNLLTPTLKIKSYEIKKRFKKEIDDMYNS